MTCDYCGCTNNVTRISKDNLRDNYPNNINICPTCAAKAFYCNICRKIEVEGVPQASGYTCVKCLDNPKICHHCGMTSDEVVDHVCPTCAPKLKTCECCGKRGLNYNKTRTGFACASCAVTRYKFCNFCETLVTREEWSSQHGMCTVCVSSQKECEYCNRLVSESHLVQFGSMLVCKSHISKQPCSCCGNNVETIYKEYSQGAVYLCASCLSSGVKVGKIHNYSYKPQGLFKGSNELKLYLGIENEVTFDSNFSGKLFVAGQLNARDPNEEQFYLKSDSSIPNGFEIVSHPMTFEYIKAHNPQHLIFDAGLYKPYEVSESCGMHIHMSKSAFTNAQLFKFLQFVYDNQPFIELVAERTANDYCMAVQKDTFIDKAKEKQGRDRDQVNLGPEYTVEIRIFRGAVDSFTYLKNIEFVHALFMFTRKVSLNNLKLANFLDFIQKFPKDYENLLTFLKKAGTIS